MSLKDRLGRLTGDAPKPLSVDSPQEKLGELRKKIESVMSRRPSAPPGMAKTRQNGAPLEQVVAGVEARTPHGSFFLSRTTLKTGDVHGNARICDIACANMEAASFLTGAPMTKNVSLSDGLFLDTETTGLSGGAGTFPFLIGLGWFEGSSFVTCQLFARDFSEEGAMLHHLCELAAGKQFLVTFNGKAFDLNLLATRFILNRRQETLTTMPHLDLLHPSRRILGHRLENARLATIESRVLGVERIGDVPGFEIPQRYFDWLRQRDGRLVGDIFEHNRMDVVSLASLLKYLTDLVDVDEMAHDHDGDFLRLAGLINERGNREKAARMLEALILSHDAEAAAGARRALSLMYKRECRWKEAAELWQGLVCSDPCDFFAVEELAKFYEHHARECGKALELVAALLNDAKRLSRDQRDSAEHRLRRLLLKVSSDQPTSGSRKHLS